ncbi:hypothetical protein BZA05DRAFT_411534 [Tricharina praecox]|uniref:uncharacterized protein n=1 Tax=Tricharina praecox TaxID=43433 RepID=UPI00221E5393|nr:uncharacterized protein BZA05DRAFT_411534 [Tricharina praecox]KAI5842820.1 hypothetical protein BZA05DRAFT_411534 [Tricharina praecox]
MSSSASHKRRESTERDPLSPPRSPMYSDEDLTDMSSSLNAHVATVEDDYEEGEGGREHIHHTTGSTAPSSPPTSIDAAAAAEKQAAFAAAASKEYAGAHHATSMYSDEDEDDFAFRHQHDTPVDDPESQWESDGPPVAGPSAPKLHSHSRTQSNTSTKKSATPSAPGGGKMFSKSSRPVSKGQQQQQLLHPIIPSGTAQTAGRRRSTHFYSSRASSASYNEAGKDGQKAPLVLLHVTLLFLPGAEEAILNKITPTMLERGLLVEHPRGDYQLLEELIIDSLGLDDAAIAGMEGDDDEEEEEDEWAKSLGVRRVKAKSKWELRVYAANGLMTPGAWKRVWGEMERVDVEVGPRNWRANGVAASSSMWKKLFSSSDANSTVKAGELMRGLARGKTGRIDGQGRKRQSNAGLYTPPQQNDVKRLSMVAGGVMLLLASSMGLFWTLSGKQTWTKETGIQNQVTYSAGGDGVPQVIVNEDTGLVEVLGGVDELGAAVDGVEIAETSDLAADPAAETLPICGEEGQSENPLTGEETLDSDTTATSTAECVKASTTETTECESSTQDKASCIDAAHKDDQKLAGDNVDIDASIPSAEASVEAQLLPDVDADAEPVLLDFAGEETTSASGWWKKTW